MFTLPGWLDHGPVDFKVQGERARMSIIKRWVTDPQINIEPDDISFGEMHAALDELQDRIDEVREMYPALPEK